MPGEDRDYSLDLTLEGEIYLHEKNLNDWLNNCESALAFVSGNKGSFIEHSERICEGIKGLADMAEAADKGSNQEAENFITQLDNLSRHDGFSLSSEELERRFAEIDELVRVEGAAKVGIDEWNYIKEKKGEEKEDEGKKGEWELSELGIKIKAKLFELGAALMYFDLYFKIKKEVENLRQKCEKQKNFFGKMPANGNINIANLRNHLQTEAGLVLICLRDPSLNYSYELRKRGIPVPYDVNEKRRPY